jgi:hypothetical protein
MLTAIIGAILPFGIKIIGWWLDKSAADAEMKRQFYGFVDSLGQRNMIAAKLHDSYKAQLERLAAADKPPQT